MDQVVRRHRRPRRARIVLIVLLVVAIAGLASVALRAGSSPPNRSRAEHRSTPAARAVDADRVDPGSGGDGWKFAVRGEPVGMTVDGEDLAIIGLRQVALVDVGTGRPRWQVDVPAPSDDQPAIAGDRVAVTDDESIALFDRATGRQVGRVRTSASGPVGFASDAARRLIAVTGSDESGDVAGFDAADASLRWTSRFDGEVWTAPQGAADVVVVASQERSSVVIRGLEPGTGAVRWAVRTGAVASAPLVVGGRVVFADGADAPSARVRALDARTGVEQWSTAAPGDFDPAIQPGSDGSTVYALDGAGSLAALDLASGTLRWRATNDFLVVDGHPVVVSGEVVFVTLGSQLVAVNAVNGGAPSTTRPDTGVVNDLESSGPWLLASIRLGRPSRVIAVKVPAG